MPHIESAIYEIKVFGIIKNRQSELKNLDDKNANGLVIGLGNCTE